MNPIDSRQPRFDRALVVPACVHVGDLAEVGFREVGHAGITAEIPVLHGIVAAGEEEWRGTEREAENKEQARQTSRTHAESQSTRHATTLPLHLRAFAPKSHDSAVLSDISPLVIARTNAIARVYVALHKK